VSDAELARIVRDHFDMRPAGIIRTLDLKRPIYRPTACYGHFGRAPQDGLFTWERTDLASTLR
jgi:S-adenosylmethionine synthetase